MTYQQPTQAVIQEFGLERYVADGNVYWIIPGAAPESWKEVSGFMEMIHFGVYHFLPERVFLSWATGDPAASFMIPVFMLALLMGLGLMLSKLALYGWHNRPQMAEKSLDVSKAPLVGNSGRRRYSRSPLETITHGSTLRTEQAVTRQRRRLLGSSATKRQGRAGVFDAH